MTVSQAWPLADPALDVQGLTVSYGRTTALRDVDLTVPAGALAAIVGPNGAGKSTLLKAVLGLIQPTAGRVAVFGALMREQRRHVAYVPQRTSVDWDFPTTVLDVAMMGLYGRLGWLRRPGRREREAAMAALDQVGLADLAGRSIGALSGGQQQRTFLARALVQQSELLILDEPMAGVDAATEEIIFEILSGLRTKGKTVVVVHHDLQTVRERFDWLALLNIEVVAQGPVAEVHTPANLSRAYGGRLVVPAAEGILRRAAE